MPDKEAPPILDYAGRSAAGDPDELVTLATLPAFEAELTSAKLESEDIRCFIANTNIAGAHPFLAIPIRVQVRRHDLDRAREILARPLEPVPDEDYVDEPWRCPKCRKKTIDLTPPTSAQRFRRNAWLLLLIMPLLWMLLPMNEIIGIPNHLASQLCLTWFALTMILGLFVVLAKRGKRCRECGWTKPA